MYNTIINRLKEQGYKITSQRQELIKALTQEPRDHPTLKDLYQRVKQKLTRISFSTLYDNLVKLEALGVLKLFTLQGETRVEMNTEPHLNMIKQTNGKIIDVENPELIKQILKELKIKQEDHELIIINILLYQ